MHGGQSRVKWLYFISSLPWTFFIKACVVTMWLCNLQTSSASSVSGSQQPSQSFWHDQFSSDEINSKDNAPLSEPRTTEKDSSNIVKAEETEANDVSFLTSEVDWDEEPFETSFQDETDSKSDIIIVGGKVQVNDNKNSETSECNSKATNIKRSVSALEPSIEDSSTSDIDTELKRSLSMGGTCESPQSATLRPKRKLPEWISKPKAQAEVLKKMKKNSLFKL